MGGDGRAYPLGGRSINQACLESRMKITMTGCFNLSRRRDRNGGAVKFVLIVLAVFGALAALLVPAVQRANEAARRSQCT